MRLKSALALAVGLFGISELRGEEGALIWEEDFTPYSVGPATEFDKNLEIREENGVKFLSKSDSETQFVIGKGGHHLPASSATWIDYVLTVRFREPERLTTTLTVKARGERPDAPYLWYYVSIGSKGIGLLCHGLPKEEYANDPRREAKVLYETMGASDLVAGEWITAHVAVGAEAIKVTVDAPDKEARSAEFKVFGGTGGIAVGSRSPLDIAVVNVRESPEPVVIKP